MMAYVTYLEYCDCYVMQVGDSNFYGELEEIERVCREYGYEMILE